MCVFGGYILVNGWWFLDRWGQWDWDYEVVDKTVRTEAEWLEHIRNMERAA